MIANRRRDGTSGASRHPGSARRPRLPLLLLVALVALSAGCEGSGQEGSAFVFLTVDGFGSSNAPVGVVNSSIANRNASTLVCATLRNNLKNPTVTAATGLDNVVIQSYTVRLTRLDGGPAPGPFTIGTAFTVPAGTIPSSGGTVTGNTVNVAIILVPAQLKNEPPLSTAPLPTAATADIVFKGRDGRGESVQTEGAITVNFVGTDFDDATPGCGGAAPTAPPPTPSP